jgi:hypothetical protein
MPSLAPPAELSERGVGHQVAFYADLKIMLPLMVSLSALLLAAATIAARWRNSELTSSAYPESVPPEYRQCSLPAGIPIALLQGTRATASSGR